MAQDWHLDKTINVSHLITTITMVASVIIWAATVETRLKIQTVQLTATEANINGHFTDIERRLGRIEKKIDRLK